MADTNITISIIEVNVNRLNHQVKIQDNQGENNNYILHTRDTIQVWENKMVESEKLEHDSNKTLTKRKLVLLY